MLTCAPGIKCFKQKKSACEYTAFSFQNNNSYKLTIFFTSTYHAWDDLYNNYYWEPFLTKQKCNLENKAVKLLKLPRAWGVQTGHTRWYQYCSEHCQYHLCTVDLSKLRMILSCILPFLLTFSSYTELLYVLLSLKVLASVGAINNRGQVLKSC